MAEVAIVIVNYNGKEFLAACLEAVRAQTLRDFVVYVVDNASEDASQTVVQSSADARFHLLQQDRNLGFAGASNVGARAAHDCDWIALVNPDACIEPQWLEKMLAVARSDARLGALGCHLVSASREGTSDGTGDQYHVSGRAWRRDHNAPVEKASQRPQGEVFAPCAAAALYRNAAWRQAGGLDEDFFCYMEDVDLAFRLRLLGWECVHVPQAVAHHVGSGSTGRRSDFSVYYGQRNLVWTFVKNMPGALFWLLLPLHLLLNLGSLALFLVRGQFRVVLRAKVDAIRGLAIAWRKRRAVQRQRTIPSGRIWALLDKRLVPPLFSNP